MIRHCRKCGFDKIYDFWQLSEKNQKDGFPSGQRGQTVNLLRLASVVRIHLHPFGFVPVMSNHDAGVAELADAQDLKSCEG